MMKLKKREFIGTLQERGTTLQGLADDMNENVQWLRNLLHGRTHISRILGILL